MIRRRSRIAVGIVIVLGFGILAWAVLRPGPLAFAEGSRTTLAAYPAPLTGVPVDFGSTDALAKGRYLTEAADCEACHTAEGGRPFAGGRPFDTPFGTLYSPNITPDPKTGIGGWSDADFLRALHRGRSPDGKWLYPAFPYAAYTYLTDADVLAIKSYLFSLPRVANLAPANSLMFPFNQRALMALWSAFYDPDRRFEPVADRSAAWNRGAYLAEALGHCGDCHTPRTAFQSLDNRRKYAGGMAEGWRAYNLTGDPDSGIGTWSPGDVEQYLKTGHSSDRGSAFGPMAQAVHLSLQRLTPSDVRALVEYVRSVPPVRTADLPAPRLARASAQPAEAGASTADARGEALFAGMCSGCHSWTGASAYVPHATLVGSRAINDPSATNVALAILRGASTLPASGDVVSMPAFGLAWSDDEVAAVSNYVVARFGARPSRITAAEIHKLRGAR